jgi:trehalose utilization protein
MTINVTVWNEYRHERESEQIAAVYPNGIHEAIAEHLRTVGDFNVRTATLDEPEHGLTDEVINSTDVMLWWGHKAHGDVSDEIVQKVYERVNSVQLRAGQSIKRVIGTPWTQVGGRQ